MPYGLEEPLPLRKRLYGVQPGSLSAPPAVAQDASVTGGYGQLQSDVASRLKAVDQQMASAKQPRWWTNLIPIVGPYINAARRKRLTTLEGAQKNLLEMQEDLPAKIAQEASDRAMARNRDIEGLGKLRDIYPQGVDAFRGEFPNLPPSVAAEHVPSVTELPPSDSVVNQILGEYAPQGGNVAELLKGLQTRKDLPILRSAEAAKAAEKEAVGPVEQRQFAALTPAYAARAGAEAEARMPAERYLATYRTGLETGAHEKSRLFDVAHTPGSQKGPTFPAGTPIEVQQIVDRKLAYLKTQHPDVEPSQEDYDSLTRETLPHYVRPGFVGGLPTPAGVRAHPSTVLKGGKWAIGTLPPEPVPSKP